MTAPAGLAEPVAPADVGPRVPTRAWIDLGVLALLAVVGMAGLETSFGSQNFLIASVAGLVIGLGVAVLATLMRWNVVISVLAGIVAYFLLGTPAVLAEHALFAVLPSLDALRGLALGAVFGWADILTLQTPVQAPYYIAVLPYFAAWLVGLVEGLLVLRWFSHRPAAWRSALLLLGPALLFLIGILLGTEEAYLAPVRGVSFAVIALIWLAWRRRASERVEVEGRGSGRSRRLVAVAAVVAGAVVIGVGVGWVVQPTRDERFVLREQIVPPFDPAQYPSPLAGFRSYTKILPEAELFTVDGLDEGGLVRLATMDAYDGILWRVTATTAAEEGSGSFRLVGSEFPEPAQAVAGETGELEVTVREYDDVWVPTTGYATGIDFLDEASAEHADDFRYNATTGTAVLMSGLREGHRYRLETVVPDAVDDDALASADILPVVMPPADNVPDIVGSKALELAGDSPAPIDQLRAIELSLRSSGFLSHGLASDAVPSRAGHGADRMAELFERSQMVGDEEQYASVFALMARSLGYPSRVVMGFAPEAGEGATTVVGDDVTAWVEVPFEGVGWVPFFPTPEQTDVPQDQVPKPQNEPQPQVRQPPRTETNEEDLLTPVEIDDSDDRDDEGLFAIPGWVIVLALSVLIPLAIALLPMLLIAYAKGRRAAARRRGRPDESVAGAWEEFLDRHRELGYVVQPALTRTTAAERLAAEGAHPELAPTLAARADTAVFSGRDVPADEADAYWSDVIGASADAERQLSRGRRLLARYRIHRLRGRRRRR